MKFLFIFIVSLLFWMLLQMIYPSTVFSHSPPGIIVVLCLIPVLLFGE